ncbi:hypothetical protein [Marichromatium gracile]|uniref:Entry exclusion lipoprotein TrbK n=1 Tax=Marichromatium gracile TaxID=1048 RepID=A0A4R4AI67_MARGR|nr:hypothetical protein [Marichromatium gracile]MBK1707899.1 hypothetical protein [Marichromatium gracile]TCW38416.1 hypothetical protein EDC29_102310 [Marichromatium gracile]
MKYMMQMLTLLSLSLMAGCSEKEENCEKANPQQEQCEKQDGTIYDSLKEPVDRSKSKEF